MSRLPVAVLGATGMVGQRFIQLLADHPNFTVTALTGSGRSAGRSYREACRWVLDTTMPAAVADLPVLSEDAPLAPRLVFSALPSDAAARHEARLASLGHIVCSNASHHRMDADVPLLMPEVNPDHLGLLHRQRQLRGWSGAIVTNPNCTSMPVTMVLKPLHDAFGIAKVLVVSMQALSGAGYPGVPSYDVIDNVIPYIGGEESKLSAEPMKMLGTLTETGIVAAEYRASAHCNRVPVLEGHTVAVSIELQRKATPAQVAAALAEWRALPQQLGLHSAPAQPVMVLEGEDRPQPRRDRMNGNGMATSVGRIRPCDVLDIKLAALSHNTIRGAAGASILNAELMLAQGWLD
jgi:aspartate-semialdehyde dehydrogenase